MVVVDGRVCAVNRIRVEMRKRCKGLKMRKVCERVKISLVACKISKTKKEERKRTGQHDGSWTE